MTRVRLDLGRLLGFKLIAGGSNQPAGVKIGVKPDLTPAMGAKIGGKPGIELESVIGSKIGAKPD
jgi:hypothetical protein